MGVTLKRLMLKAAEAIADQMNIDVLVTGESVAQVSSQTLRNLAIIDEVSHKLILRPLAVMDKPDIMAIADKIGTRRFAEATPEYCGVISKNPTVNASFKRMAWEAKQFDETILHVAIEQAQFLAVDKIIEQVNAAAAVEVVTNPVSEVVIDIRSPAEAMANPLKIKGGLEIPFYELNQSFKRLDDSRVYLLYCEKGVMSQLHAQYLKDAGYANVKVYRPSK